MNVKKTDTQSSVSDMEDIKRFAFRDREFLLRQMKAIDPTVIVCGYTVSFLNIILHNTEDRGIKDYAAPNENWYYFATIDEKKIPVLDYYHPSNHYPDLLNYYGLMHIYQLALKNI